VRLADQASFGATEDLVKEIRARGAAKWIANQMGAVTSRYTSGMGPEVHQWATASPGFCDGRGANCSRDWKSSTPLQWDFYRNAMWNPDQLRQRVAFALQQMIVVSGLTVEGTYGLRNYQNMLLDEAFGNYRSLLKKVALSPVMGTYLHNANNSMSAPNEDFGRELLQIFSIGTCALNMDGTLKGGNCMPVYNNDRVRDYAYALTGWTYPAGGVSPYGMCWPKGANCPYYVADMVPLAGNHDSQARTLLSGVTLAPGHSAPQALEAVLDSLMKHPNIAPSVSKQLIKYLVTSNPSPAYVQRVATAFTSGSYQGFGTGTPGDMKATVAAILLDADARTENPGDRAGRLREPVQFMVGVLRGLYGKTDGNDFGGWWGGDLGQYVFRPPSVFGFYSQSFPVSGTDLVGPAFGIHSANTALGRLNYITYLLYWNGSAPKADIPNALGTKVNLDPFLADAPDPTKLVDRMSMIAFGQPLPTSARTEVIRAVATHTADNSGTTYLRMRVQTAAYLVFGSPQYQIIR
jgi:uncharacterized protein (DUF1800 family)